MNAIIYLLVALGSFLLVLQHRRSLLEYTASRSFVLMCLVASIGFGSFGLHLIWSSTIFHLIYPMAAALLPAVLMGFLVRWLEVEQHTADNYLWGLGLAVGALHLVLKISMDAKDSTIGAPEYLISAWFLGSSAFGLYWLWQLFAQSRDAHRIRLQQMLGLIMVAVISLLIEGWLRLTVPDLQLDDISALQQIAALQGPVPPMGAVVSMLTLYVLHLNVRRTRLVSLQEFFSRIFAHGVTSLIFTLVVALSLFLGGRYSLHTGFQVWLISLLFVLLLPNLHWSVQQISDHILNQQGSDLEAIVDDLSEQIRHVVNELELGTIIVNKIHESGRVQRVSIYFQDSNNQNFVRHSWLGWGEHPEHFPSATLFEHIQFGNILKYKSKHSKRYNPIHQDILTAMQADLLFPIWKEDVLYGCLTIKSNDRTGGFSRMEMGSIAHLLEIASSQFSTFNAVVQIQDAHRRQGLQLMAHGFFRQIQPIISSTEHSLATIQDPTLMPDERNMIVENCAQDLTGIQDLLHAVYSISRPAEFERTPVQIMDQIEQAVSILQSDDIKIQVQCETEMPKVQASEQVISQIWPALYHNAIEASSSMIGVTLRLGICRRTQMRGQPAVVVQFKDNGNGIPQDLLSAVTIPMFTTKDGHSGLGLSMVQHIMDVHNGELGIHSTLSNGCTITLRFPIARQNT